ncbi:hypothetical protein BY458DRAFT_440048 [Sporodiniella umbellata]|nr:hypothetical protein BY458DRAFT_440048 [Sporodiniella umbellata]
MLHGVVPTKKGTCGSARRSNASKLFQQSKREADKVASIYQSKKPAVTPVTQRIRAPSKPNQVKPPKIIPPIPTTASSVIRPEKIRGQESLNSKPTESRKPVAMVNFNIFKEVNKD